MRRRVWAYSAVGTASFLVWAAPAGAQAFDWTGSYIGASFGVVFADGTVPLNYPAGVTAPDTVFFNSSGVPLFSSDASPIGPIAFPNMAYLAATGLFGSLNLGYDQQRGVVVYGGELEASFFGTGSTWSTGEIVDSTNGRTHSLSVSGGVDQLYTARARIGVAVDRLLLFGTGGLALGHNNLETIASLIDNGYNSAVGDADWRGRASNWQLGYIIGGGAEYAVTDHISLKLEGSYFNLGKATVNAAGTGTYSTPPTSTAVTVAPYSASQDVTGITVKSGINVRF